MCQTYGQNRKARDVYTIIRGSLLKTAIWNVKEMWGKPYIEKRPRK